MGKIMSVAEALAAIPEPEGVTLYRYTPFWETGLAVAVACVSGTAGICDAPDWRRDELRVPLDLAHDLSRQGPQVYIALDHVDWRGSIRWRITALGITEQEAEKAFHAVCAAVMK